MTRITSLEHKTESSCPRGTFDVAMVILQREAIAPVVPLKSSHDGVSKVCSYGHMHTLKGLNSSDLFYVKIMYVAIIKLFGKCYLAINYRYV